MFKHILIQLIRLFILILTLALAAFLIPRLITQFYSKPRIYPAEQIPSRRVAIVFGAGLLYDGSPTPVLRDRVAMAAKLYFAGKVEKILMSGDNRFIYYNEPGSMQQYAISLGVPEADIVLDYAGRRTYDTCYRARQIFDVRSAILVTQGFHLPRALYTCNMLGISAVGVASDLREYRERSLLYWNLRELPATLAALWEVHFSRPEPVLGQPEPIFSSGN